MLICVNVTIGSVNRKWFVVRFNSRGAMSGGTPLPPVGMGGGPTPLPPVHAGHPPVHPGHPGFSGAMIPAHPPPQPPQAGPPGIPWPSMPMLSPYEAYDVPPPVPRPTGRGGSRNGTSSTGGRRREAQQIYAHFWGQLKDRCVVCSVVVYSH